jgi:hypothetical protein
LEASGYQPYLISPEKPLKFPIKGVKWKRSHHKYVLRRHILAWICYAFGWRAMSNFWWAICTLLIFNVMFIDFLNMQVAV